MTAPESDDSDALSQRLFQTQGVASWLILAALDLTSERTAVDLAVEVQALLEDVHHPY